MSIEGKQIINYNQYNKNPWLIEFFKNSNIKTILESSDNQFNELEEVFFQILENIWLNVAEGEQLDVIGIHVGLERNGKSDTDYRILLANQININVSSGEPEALISAVRIMFNITNVLYKPEYPAKVILYTNETISLSDSELLEGLRILVNILPSGVGLLWSDNLIDHTGDFIVTEAGDEIICPFFV